MAHDTDTMDQYQAEGWRFEVSSAGVVRPTTFEYDATGRPTFERWRDAVEVQTYLELSGYFY